MNDAQCEWEREREKDGIDPRRKSTPFKYLITNN